MRNLLFLSLGFVSITALSSCQTAQRNPAFAPKRPSDTNSASNFKQQGDSDRPDAVIHLVSTTDLHGYLLAQPTTGGLSIGGVDVMKGYFNIVRQSDPNTLFLDSGDLFQGTIISNGSEGAAVVTWMNSMGYTASAIGNHDFDFGPGNGSVITQPGQDPRGALKAREAQSQFKYLSANICSTSEDPGKCADVTSFQPASFTTPYIIQTVNGVRVGIIGVTTTSTPDTTLASNVTGLKFFPIAQSLDRYVTQVAAQGVDAIIVLAHEGGFCTKGTCNPQDPIFSAIDSMQDDTRKGITAILAGHTHSYANTVYNGVKVMINGKYGNSFGYLTLTLHGEDGSVTVDKAQSTDFCSKVFPDTHNCSKGTGTPVAATFLGQTVTPDPSALALLSADIQKANTLAAQVVGKLITPLAKSATSNPESSIGELMADAFRNCTDSTCTHPADIAFQNNGGIRSTGMAAGSVNYGEVFQLDPFDDYRSVLQMTGAQVHDLLAGFWDYGKNLPQVSGLIVTYSASSTTQRTITNPAGASKTVTDPIVSITLSDGTAFDETKTYSVVMTDFLATGGSGAGTTVNGMSPAINYGRLLRDAIQDYFKANATGLDYSKMSGRLVIQNGQDGQDAAN